MAVTTVSISNTGKLRQRNWPKVTPHQSVLTSGPSRAASLPHSHSHCPPDHPSTWKAPCALSCSLCPPSVALRSDKGQAGCGSDGARGWSKVSTVRREETLHSPRATLTLPPRSSSLSPGTDATLVVSKHSAHRETQKCLLSSHSPAGPSSFLLQRARSTPRTQGDTF